jgi:hypothetical protein
VRPPAVALLVAAVVVPLAASAEPGRLVLGTHDGALASALSVAVSPRGLSVVELPDALARTSDLESARRELEAQDAVAVVWLCDDDAGKHALCFCARDGRFVARPVSVSSPLAAPDAAALALSVKVLLGPATPPRAAAAPPPAASPPAPRATLVPPAEPGQLSTLPLLTAELVGGVRVQGDDPRAGARFGFTAVLAPDRLARRVGVGLGLAAGPRQTVTDVAVRAIARLRAPLRPLWLDLDLGPSLHFLSIDLGSSTTRGTQLSLDALAGVILPLGPYFAGVRAGVLLVPSPSAAPSLPRWSGEVHLIFGANVL